jgi:small-conductance mechanosensitive channel
LLDFKRGAWQRIAGSEAVEMELLVSSMVITVAAGLAGLLISLVVGGLVERRHGEHPIEIASYELHLQFLRTPFRLLLPAVAIWIAQPWLEFPQEILNVISHVLQIWIIFALAYFFRRLFVMVREMLLEEHPIDVEDNLQARRIMTQYRVIERIGTVLITVLAVGAILMTFPGVRQFGVSLLASAGIAGVVLGFAAQKSLGTLLAGIQIAVSQPIRLDDVVIVEGEWGRVEEITLTYVVVRVWDERRLIVPVTYFLDNPFQNWTYTSAEILGTVFVYADYSVPVEKVRKELKRILDSTELWDGRVWSLLVTNSTERTMEMRALVSAANSSKAWDLRCLVREQLVDFLQREYPHSLPKVRLESNTGGE